MAKRRRLIPALLDSNSAENAPLEVKAFLRPSLGTGLSAPPIAQVAGEASAQSALAELSEAMTRARSEGRLVQALPLDQIEIDHLVRDRIETDEEELGHLIASIREHGQRSPIEVTELAPGRYGLISGWRRIKALTRLFAETGEARHSTVQALLRRPESASDAYIAMVEENEVRLGLSYYERARIAARAVDLGVFETEKQALQRLFAAASRARRSKIGSFLSLYRALDAALRFPAAIPERLGLALAKAVENSPERLADFSADLVANPAQTAAEELARLAAFAEGRAETAATEPVSKPEPQRRELRPGVFLEISGGWTKPVLTLSGPNVGPAFRDQLERWLAG
jgi:ParB family transcriptional regulator, chromosome partitioning protein